jgi:hypothetical protein
MERWSHKHNIDNANKNSNSSTFVPLPPIAPRPPSVPHLRYYNDITNHKARVEEILHKRGPRPVIRPNNKQQIPDKSFRVQPILGKRTTWSVPDYENDEREDSKRPNYHAIDICGSGFDGLATTIETHINEGQIQNAINQVNTCINQREPTAKDKSHQKAIMTLKNFLRQLKWYDDNPVSFNDIINDGGFIVRYNEYIGELSDIQIIPRRNLTFTTKSFSAGKYKKTYRKRRNKKGVKCSRKQKHKLFKT